MDRYDSTVNDMDLIRNQLEAIVGDLNQRVEDYYNWYLKNGIPKVPDSKELREIQVFQNCYNSYSDTIECCLNLIISCDIVVNTLVDLLNDSEIKSLRYKKYIKTLMNRQKTNRFNICQIRTLAYGRLKFLQELMYSNQLF